MGLLNLNHFMCDTISDLFPVTGVNSWFTPLSETFINMWGMNRHQISSFHTFFDMKDNYFRRFNFVNVGNNYNERDLTSKIIISHNHLC